MTRYLALALAMLAAPALVADDRLSGEKLAREIAPYVDDQALAVVHVDLARLDPEPTLKLFEKLKATKKQIEEGRREIKRFLDVGKQAGLKRGWVVVSLADLPEAPPLVVLPLEKNSEARMLAALLAPLVDLHTWEKDGFMVLGSERGINRVKKHKPADRPELARALDGAGTSAIHAVFTAHEDLRRAIEELNPRLPRELGGGPSTILTRGFKWASLSVNLAPAVGVSLNVQAADETAARALGGLFAGGLELLGKEKSVREVWPDFVKLSAMLLPKTAGDRLTLELKEEQLLTLLGPAVQRAREAAAQAVAMNNLRQVGIGFHTYHDVKQAFPAHASHDKQGNPLLSWRVHLLPHIGQEALYKEFKLDEPWDSEHNKKLIPKMPRVYAPTDPRLTAMGRTLIVVPTGPGTAFDGKEGITIAKVTDGLSNTILAVEIDEDRAVVWTKPEDLPIGPKQPAHGLRKVDGKGFIVLFMDGSTRFLPADIDPKTLWALFTPSGGEVINLP